MEFPYVRHEGEYLYRLNTKRYTPAFHYISVVTSHRVCNAFKDIKIQKTWLR